MRLYLTIERNSLPPVKTVWPLPTNDQKYTTASLLEAVNAIFPLEAEQWGLEDYVVTLNGHELLHYHEIKSVCKDGEEVTIRPLQTVEVRARTISGRAQISSDGRHLIDGIAFGKPALKSPVRPVVRIPPRKRIRLMEDGEHDGLEEVEKPTLLLTNGDVDTDEESDDDDEDFMDEDLDVDENDNTTDDVESDGEDESETSNESGFASLGDEDSSSGHDYSNETSPRITVEKARINGKVKSNRSSSKTPHGSEKNIQSRRVSSRISSVSNLLAPSSDEQMESSASTNDHSSDTSSEDSDSDDDSASDSAQSLIVEKNVPRQLTTNKAVSKQNKISKTTAAQQHGEGQSQLINKNSEIDSDAIQTNGINERIKVLPQKEPLQYVGIPGEGNSKTRNRAQRKKQSQRLKYLQEQGILPSTADFEVLRAYENSPSTFNRDTIEDGDDTVDVPEQISSKQVIPAANGTATVDTTNVGVNRQLIASDSELISATPPSSWMMQAVNGGRIGSQEPRRSIQAVVDDTIRSLISSDSEQPEVATSETITNSALSMIPPSVMRRPKTNVSALNRMIFGSLGVRAPKSDQEKEALRNKLAAQSRGISEATQPAATELYEQAKEADDDDEEWTSKIELSAVETVDEELELDTPPFPFHQHWTAVKRGRSEFEEDEENGLNEFDHEDIDEDINGELDEELNDEIDDEDEEEHDDDRMPIRSRYYENAELIEAGARDREQVGSSANKSNHFFDPDWFPPVPTLEQYQALPSIEEIAPSDSDSYLVYGDLACNESTGYQPESVLKVVKLIENVGDNRWKVKVNEQDLPQKRYDEDGNRILGRFEIEMSEDEDENEDELEARRFTELDLSQLNGPKVL